MKPDETRIPATRALVVKFSNDYPYSVVAFAVVVVSLFKRFCVYRPALLMV